MCVCVCVVVGQPFPLAHFATGRESVSCIVCDLVCGVGDVFGV